MSGLSRKTELACSLESLRASFGRAAVAHVAIDMQEFYCNQHFHRNRPYEYNRAVRDLVGRVDSFADTVRGRLSNIWVYHRMERKHHDWPGVDDEHYCRVVNALSGKAKPEGDIVIGKRRYDAFETHDFNAALARQRVGAVLLTGLYFHRCVLETAIGARKTGLESFIVADLTDMEFLDYGESIKAARREGIHLVRRRDVERAMQCAPEAA